MFKYEFWDSLYEQFTYIHIYNFSTYVKMHLYVIVEYLLNAINLMTIVTNGTYQPIMDENICKLDPTNGMKILIVTS